MLPTYYFLIGIPDSGKSHFARRLAEETGAEIVCPDEIRASYRVRSERAFEIARELIKKNLKAGRDVIFDATNTLRRWRRENILAGKPFATRVVCCIFDTPLELCMERQRRRAAQGEKADLPETVIARMDQQIEDNPPALEEGFDEIRVYAGIFMTITSGKLAGRVRQIFTDQVKPKDLLTDSVRHGWHWKIDYSHATPDEVFLWLQADLNARARLAKQEGRPVFFGDQEFQDLQEWEDAITSSGQMVTIDRDDETGFWVKCVGPDPDKN